MSYLDVHTRTAESPEGSAVQSATIPLPVGVWEITDLHLVLGGHIATVTNISAHAFGSVRYEAEDQQSGSEADFHQAKRLVSGDCTLLHALVMDGTRVVVNTGGGRIKSYMQHGVSVVHTLTVTFRRVIT